MMTFLILLLHAFAASAAGGKATGPCQCDNGWQQVRYETTLHFRDVRLSLDAELRKAEWAAIVRAVFSLSFCGTPPAGISVRGSTALEWPEAGCTATRRGPRPWPEMVEVKCETTSSVIPLPGGIRLDTPITWLEHGEELNRYWTALVSASRECPAP